jgi:hydrogenase expression/formation protein HypE
VTEQGSWSPRDIGDGAGAFDQFFAQELLSRFPSPELGRRSDASRLSLGPVELAVTCDAFTVDPLFFPGGDIGKLAVCGTANDLLTEGARPDWLMMSVVMDEQVGRRAVTRVLDSLAEQAALSGSTLIGGDTKSVKSAESGLVITMTGLGVVRRVGPPLGFEHARPGDELVVTGPVASHSIAVLSAREGLGFERVVSSDCRDVGLDIAPLVTTDPAVRGLRDATRGGMVGVLHEIVNATGMVAELEVEAVPVATEVKMAAEMLGLDPLELTNEGCFVIVAEEGTAQDLVAQLKGSYGLADAAVVGKLAEGKASFSKKVLLRRGNDVRVAVRSLGAGIPRLC